MKLIKKIIKIYFKIVYMLLSLVCKKNYICFCYGCTSERFLNLDSLLGKIDKDESLSSKVLVLKYTESVYKHLYYFSISKIIVIDQTNKYLSIIKLSNKTRCVQIWHGGGLYKKVGYDSIRKGYDINDENERISRIHGNIDYFIISDPKLIQNYSKMFRIKKEKVLPLGMPRTDKLYQLNKEFILNNFLAYYNLDRKKIILYAPTFRSKNGKMYHNYNLDFVLLESKLGNDYHLVLRKHPNVIDTFIPRNWIVETHFDNNELGVISDMLITDYSSYLFDYSITEKPIILYTPDIDEYICDERGLYYRPCDLVGSSNNFTNTSDMINAILNSTIVGSESINKRFMSSCDGKSGDRVMAFIHNLIGTG